MNTIVPWTQCPECAWIHSDCAPICVGCYTLLSSKVHEGIHGVYIAPFTHRELLMIRDMLTVTLEF